MGIQRRFLPPIGWLTALEAVIRLGSVTAAADELNLTQGAVSRQIAKLEDQLGVALFLRVKKRLKPTPQGRAYAATIREAMAAITNATVNLATNPEGGTLELAILPSFGTHWLAPRLPDFHARHPGISLNLSTRMALFDFSQSRFHAAIHFGRDPWPATRSLALMDERALPVLAPGLLAGSSDAISDAISGAPGELTLLTLETRPRAWQHWFAAMGSVAPQRPRMRFDQYATLLQATVAGLGAALLPDFIAEPEIAAGRLVRLGDGQTVSLGTYSLVWPQAHEDYPPLRALRDWMAELPFGLNDKAANPPWL
ncbi:MAG: LysR family transcriptional regulator [Nitratireductor sp.]|nr:LysR family transcriptional regulator [Nitratireductor sp.]